MLTVLIRHEFIRSGLVKLRVAKHANKTHVQGARNLADD